jgi:hypothetical protein
MCGRVRKLAALMQTGPSKVPSRERKKRPWFVGEPWSRIRPRKPATVRSNPVAKVAEKTGVRNRMPRNSTTGTRSANVARRTALPPILGS